MSAQIAAQTARTPGVEMACKAYDSYAAQCSDVSASHYPMDAALEAIGYFDVVAALLAVMNGQIGGNVDHDADRFQQARAALAKAGAL